MTVSQKNKRKRNTKFSRNIRRGGGPEEEAKPNPISSITNGIYEFDANKTLYVCSDLEGGNNFKESGKLINHDLTDIQIEQIETNHIDIGKKDEVFGELNKAFTFDDGIINGINDNVCLAYTGDLFDNRPHNFRLLKNMISLKDRYMDRVIIIGGNRDFNKLRLGIELFLVSTKIDPETNQQYDNIKDLLASYNEHGDQCISEMLKDVTIDFNEKNVPDYVKVSPGDLGILNTAFEATQHKFFSRVSTIFAKSMAIPFEVYMIEIRDIMIKLNLLTSEEINNEVLKKRENKNILDKMCKFFCILVMVMYFKYPPGIAIVEKLCEYHGILNKYFEFMQPIAKFKIGEKTGILTHSGLPPTSKDNLTDVFLGYPTGEPFDETKPDIMIKSMITLYNDEWNNINDNILSLMINNNNVPTKIVKFINLCGWGTSPGANQYPIIGRASVRNNYTQLDNLYIGGERFFNEYNQRNEVNRIFDFKEKSDSTGKPLRSKLDYHIFGHEPQKWFPGVIGRDGGTKHIALDVCRNDGGGGINYYSFAVLKIPGKTKDEKGKTIQDKIIGRTLFGGLTDEDGNLITRTDDEFNNKVLYYINPLKDFQFSLKEENNMGTYIRDLTEFVIDEKYRKKFNFRIEYVRDTGKNFRVISESASAASFFMSKKKSAKEPAPTAAAPTAELAGGSFFGGSNKKCKHVCGALCKKCHKHDKKCMLACELCEEENCNIKHKKTRRKSRMARFPHKKTKKRKSRMGRFPHKKRKSRMR